ncbi:hypothetical protein LTR36_006408 [Oleoguttula mirabilis]|uniref:Uncharacterized protein n=1 Tax=Oleoguttula mirabilis TaxID=1507867 RepID=A0AAV9JWJ9_9PEZI|nr:hypothetical protein LTR36_006408 [Oleoguttula mirabilis]
MHHSFFATALCLSLIQTSDARAHGRSSQLQIRDGKAEVQEARHGVVDWFKHLFKKDDALERRQESTCVEDDFYNFVNNSTFGESFCQSYIEYPNTTVTADYTPTSTFTDLFTTNVLTHTSVLRTTPGTTVTLTVTAGAANAKRDPQVTARATLNEAQMADFIAIFRRQQAANSSIANISVSDSVFSSAFSSACSCQTYGGSIVTETYTNEPEIVTLSAYADTTTTVVTTRVARPLTSTVIVSVGASTSTAVTLATGVSASITVSASGAPTATAPAFTCPDDDNTTVSQMVNNERFDYTVMCDTDLTDPTFYGSLYYSSFSACVAACSTNDYNFQSAVCQGVSYYNTVNEDGYNCFMKTSANGTVPAAGVGSALLQRIVVGISNTSPAGTITEFAPFTGETPTQNASELSSIVSSLMGNSTSSMPIITPGPPMPVSGMLVNAGSTYYSTYVSNGSTFSSGTAYYTSYNSGSSWFVSYYTSYTEAWSSATTVYASSAQETGISSTNSTSTSVESGDDGDYSDISTTISTTNYPGGYNETVVVSNSTYAANGTELSSTAVTSYYSYATGSSNSSSGSSSGASGTGNGTGAGAAGYGASGLVTGSGPTPITSTESYYSTETVIVNSGGTAGASGYVASGYVSGATPSTSVTTIVGTFGTAYSSGYIISGGIGGAGGASGYVASGDVSTLPTSTSTAVIVISGGTGYASGYVASGAVSSPTPSVSISTTIIINTAGTAYSSGFVASGSLGGYGGASSTLLSGAIPSSGSPSPSFSFSAPAAPRSGTDSSSIPLITGTAYSSAFVASGSLAGYGGASSTVLSGVLPSGSPSPSYSFGAPTAPRAPGSVSSSTLVGTAPGSPPLYTAPTPVSYGTAPSGTAPTSYSFGAPSAPRGSGSVSSSIPLLTASYGTAPPYSPSIIETLSNTAGGYSPPPGYGPSSTLTASVNATTGLAPTGTAPPSYSFSAPPAPRSGYPLENSSVPTGMAPTAYTSYPVTLTAYGTAPIPYGTAPGTGPIPYGTSPPSSGYPAPTVNITGAPVPTGSYPPGYSFSAPGAPRSGYPGSSSGSPVPSMNTTSTLAPTAPPSYLTAPTGTSPPSYSFGASGAPRSGYPAGTGTAPPSYPSFPTAPASTCGNMTAVTITIYSTYTSFGCLATCMPDAGSYGSPQSFGPPVFNQAVSSTMP